MQKSANQKQSEKPEKPSRSSRFSDFKFEQELFAYYPTLKLAVYLVLPLLAGLMVNAVIYRKYISFPILIWVIATDLAILIVDKTGVENRKKTKITIFLFKTQILAVGIFLLYAICINGRWIVLPWTYVFAYFAILMIGMRSGAAIVVFLSAILFIYYVFFPHPEQMIPEHFLLQFFSSLLMCTIFIACTEYVRIDYREKLAKTNMDLGESEKKYRKLYEQLAKEIIEHIKTQKTLEESENRLRSIFEASPDPIVVYDARCFPLYINPGFTRIFEWTLEELKGRRIPFVPEDQKETTSSKIQKVLASGKPERFFSTRFTQSGAVVDVVVSAAMIKGFDGEQKGLVVSFTDISEQLKLEARLQQARKMESVARLAGGVAHDFNNMLGVILGHTEVAIEKTGPFHPARTDLANINKAARRSADLTQQLLAFARQQMALPEILDLNETVSGMTTMLKRLLGDEILLEWIPAHELWPVKIDPAQLDQILADLAANAKDAISGKGKVVIETKNKVMKKGDCVTFPGLVPGQYVLLSVTDSGEGMSRQTLDNIFEPFFTTKEVGRGIGMGLSTVYGIVKQNNGFIYADSTPGHGSSFWIFLPRSMEEAKVKKKKTATPSIKARETVLLIEEDEAVLKMNESLLESLGYKVLSAKTPSEAVLKAKNYTAPIHLLISDVVLPEMSGEELKAELEKSHPEIRSLFISEYEASIILDQKVLSGNVHFLQKPFSTQSFSRKVKEVLNRKDGTDL